MKKIILVSLLFALTFAYAKDDSKIPKIRAYITSVRIVSVEHNGVELNNSVLYPYWNASYPRITSRYNGKIYSWHFKLPIKRFIYCINNLGITNIQGCLSYYFSPQKPSKTYLIVNKQGFPRNRLDLKRYDINRHDWVQDLTIVNETSTEITYVDSSYAHSKNYKVITNIYHNGSEHRHNNIHIYR